MNAPADITRLRLELWTSNSWRRFHFQNGGPACEPVVQRDGHPDLHFAGGADGPVARRMLASWNACVGITTERLEQLAERGGFAQERIEEAARLFGDPHGADEIREITDGGA